MLSLRTGPAMTPLRNETHSSVTDDPSPLAGSNSPPSAAINWATSAAAARDGSRASSNWRRHSARVQGLSPEVWEGIIPNAASRSSAPYIQLSIGTYDEPAGAACGSVSGARGGGAGPAVCDT